MVIDKPIKVKGLVMQNVLAEEGILDRYYKVNMFNISKIMGSLSILSSIHSSIIHKGCSLSSSISFHNSKL